MIALLQRVSDSHVEIEGKTVSQIGKGLTVFLCVEQKDGEREADALLKRLLTYRVFHDDAGKMNLSVKDVGGGLLLIPQFTLAADTNSGTRPSFSPAAAPDEGKRLFEYFAKQAKNAYETVETGIFGADMKVTIVNDGPVTFWLQVKPK